MPRWSRFRRLFGPEPKADVDAELSFHVEMRVRELIEQGVPPERARTLALQRFGDYDSSRAACVEISKRRGRRMARREYLTELRQDAVYALRMLRRAPGFTIVALTTLALGIGANSAIFSVVQGVLLAPLPFRDAERLYRVTTLYPDGSPYSLSAPDFMSVREQTRTFDQVEAFSGGVFTMLGAGEPREIRGTNVSDGLLSLLGLPVTVGRPLLPGENQPGHDRVAVLDHGFWQRQFGGDRSVLGRTVSIAGTSGRNRRCARAGRSSPRRGGCLPATGVRRDIQRGDGEGAARRVPHSDCQGEARSGPRADLRRSPAHWHAAANRVSGNERHADIQRRVRPRHDARRRANASPRSCSAPSDSCCS